MPHVHKQYIKRDIYKLYQIRCAAGSYFSAPMHIAILTSFRCCFQPSHAGRNGVSLKNTTEEIKKLCKNMVSSGIGGGGRGASWSCPIIIGTVHVSERRSVSGEGYVVSEDI